MDACGTLFYTIYYSFCMFVIKILFIGMSNQILLHFDSNTFNSVCMGSIPQTDHFIETSDEKKNKGKTDKTAKFRLVW